MRKKLGYYKLYPWKKVNLFQDEYGVFYLYRGNKNYITEIEYNCAIKIKENV